MKEKENALFSLCFLGVPCRYHGRSVPSPAKFKNLSAEYNLIPVCPEQMGGLPTPRPGAPLKNKNGLSLKNTLGQDVSANFIAGANYALGVARLYECKKAFLCEGSPSCDKEGFTGELLRQNGITVINL